MKHVLYDSQEQIAPKSWHKMEEQICNGECSQSVILIEQLLHLDELLSATTEAALKAGPFRDLSRKDMVILQIVGKEGGKIMGEIAEVVGVTLGTLTGAAKKLEKKGYVERRRQPEDQRKVALYLTPKGEKARRLYRRFRRVFTERVIQGVPSKDLERAGELFSLLGDRAEALYRDYRQRRKTEQNVAKIERLIQEGELQGYELIMKIHED